MIFWKKAFNLCAAGTTWTKPCNTLQHTHCNTLYHTAICRAGATWTKPCNSLQHTHCNTLWHTVIWEQELLELNLATHCNTQIGTPCNTLQYTEQGLLELNLATHCNSLQHTHCDTLQHSKIYGAGATWTKPATKLHWRCRRQGI